MKNFDFGILKSNRFAMAVLGTVLAMGVVSCDTSPAPNKSISTTNSGGPPSAIAPSAETAAGTNAPTGYYTCAMHPNVRSLDPDGKCPFCQMPLMPAENVSVTDPDSGKTYTAATFPAVSGFYSCPLHPKVLSQNSNDVCPICGKALLPVENPVFHENR